MVTATVDSPAQKRGRRKLTPAERAERRERSQAPYKDAVARRALRATLPAIDPRALYPIPLALVYGDYSRKSLYEAVKAGQLKLVKRGRRSFVLGADLLARVVPEVSAAA